MLKNRVDQNYASCHCHYYGGIQALKKRRLYSS